jgi:hypothetical protein
MNKQDYKLPSLISGTALGTEVRPTHNKSPGYLD